MAQHFEVNAGRAVEIRLKSQRFFLFVPGT